MQKQQLRHIDCGGVFIYLEEEDRYICEKCHLLCDERSAVRLSIQYFSHDKGVNTVD